MKKTLFLLIASTLFVFLACGGEQEENVTSVDLDEVEEKTVNTCSDGGNVVDGVLTDSRDGQSYSTVEIGEQCWMAENLNYDNGCSGELWADDLTGGWCGCYKDESSNCEDYGLLYQWNAAMGGSKIEGAQGLCPDGWHLPSDGEWKTLEVYLGMNQEDVESMGPRDSGSLKLKLQDEKHKDYTGFNALFGGRRVGDGDFSDLGTLGYFWSSTASVDNAWRRYLDSFLPGIDRRATFQGHAFSVRCVRD